MPTKIIELRQPIGPDTRRDPNCRACGHPTPKGHISASDLWGWAQKQPTPIRPFRDRDGDPPSAA
jgi:hypothetical protein